MDKEKYISEAKMREKPKKPPFKFRLGEKCVKNKHIDDGAVDARTIEDKAVTIDKLSEDIQTELEAAQQLDGKYENITNELYNMVESLQVGGVALSNVFGNRTDIGISQKTLTDSFHIILEILSEITGQPFADFTLTVQPTLTYTEAATDVQVKADCTGAIKNFDSIKIYVNDELVDESSDVAVYNTTVTIDKTSTIKAVGTFFGKKVEKSAVSVIEIPFFLGSGQNYTDIMDDAHRRIIEGTIEGNYDIRIDHTGDYLFIIIPKSRENEWRRADMNGYEIPMAKTVMENWIVYKSTNTYKAGLYNIDIDINT